MGFRAFLVMDNKVARQAMAENGGKWSKMVENGRKWVAAVIWQEMDFRAFPVIPLLLGWLAKATVLFSFPISTYIIHKSTGNSSFVTSQIDISQARSYSRFFTLMHRILIISVFINEPQCQNTTTTITHQNEFVSFGIQSIMTPFSRAFLRYCRHLIRGVLSTTTW